MADNPNKPLKLDIRFGSQNFGFDGYVAPFGRSPSREEILAHENRELRQLLEDITSNPGVFAAVLEVEDKYVTICTGPQIISVKKPHGMKGLEIGSVVRLTQIPNQPANIAMVCSDPPIGGPVLMVNEVIDDRLVNVSVGPGSRLIYYDKKKMELGPGDRIALDFSERVAVRCLGKGDKKQVFAEETGISWDDIGGLEEAKRELIEAIEEPILHKELYKRYGRTPSRGILLHGAPGTGKTMLGKAAATALAKVHGAKAKSGGFLYVKGPEILNMFVGNSEANIRKLFASAREYKKQTGFPAIVFIDEADAIMGKRGARQGLEGMERTLVPQFLAEMDGLEDAGCMVLLATNRPDTLDPAVVRVGRVDTKIFVRRPNLEETKKIFTLYLKKAPLAQGVKLEVLVESVSRDLFSDRHALLMVRCKDGKDDNSRFALKELVSGALISGIVQKALQKALRRERETGEESGLTDADLCDTIKDMTIEYRSLDHTAAVSDFCEANKLHGKVTGIERMTS